MLKSLTLAVALIAATAPGAFAQNSSLYEDDDRDRDREMDRDQNMDRDEDVDRDEDRGDAMRDRRDRMARGGMERDRRDWGRAGPRRGRPDGPPPPRNASFRIDFGPGHAFRVNCGEEAIDVCVEAARPILDTLKIVPGPLPDDEPAARESAAPVTDVPPPPADLVNPPEAGEASPPPPPPAG